MERVKCFCKKCPFRGAHGACHAERCNKVLNAWILRNMQPKVTYVTDEGVFFSIKELCDYYDVPLISYKKLKEKDNLSLSQIIEIFEAHKKQERTEAYKKYFPTETQDVVNSKKQVNTKQQTTPQKQGGLKQVFQTATFDATNYPAIQEQLRKLNEEDKEQRLPRRGTTNHSTRELPDISNDKMDDSQFSF